MNVTAVACIEVSFILDSSIDAHVFCLLRNKIKQRKFQTKQEFHNRSSLILFEIPKGKPE